MKKAYSQDYLRKSYADHRALWESKHCWCQARIDDSRLKIKEFVSNYIF